MELTQERLKELLHYNPSTGEFTRKVSTTNTTIVGEVAGGIGSHGYVQIRLLGKSYLAHRLAWFYMTGNWPRCYVDHIDSNPKNNSWKNLRQADKIQNTYNRGPDKNSGSKYKGVCYHKLSNKWRAQIGHRGKQIYLGLFQTEIEAAIAYNKAVVEYQGEFARLNKI